MIFIFGSLVVTKEHMILDYPQWNMVNILGERIDSNLRSVSEIIKSGERVGNVGASSYSFKISDSESLFNDGFRKDIYCSDQIYNHIGDISNKRGIVHFYIGGKDVPFQYFRDNIKDNNVDCILVDSYENSLNQYIMTGDNKQYFLRSDEDFYFGLNFDDNLGFYKIAVIKTTFFIIIDLIFALVLTLMISYIVSIFYHKIILYIIFGKDKSIS